MLSSEAKKEKKEIYAECESAWLAVYDEFDLSDPDYAEKVFDRILEVRFDAEAERRGREND